MPTEFHRYLFDNIQRNAKSEMVLVAELVPLLKQSKGNIYKKINGKVPFSGEEIIVMARHFGISLDQHIHNGHSDFDKISFDYSLPQHQARTPLQFLEKIRNNMERIAQLLQPKIRYVSNEVPIFHSVMCRNLLAFKLYVWSRTNWKLPEMLHTAFNPDEIYECWPELEEQRQAIVALYHQIPSKEYWPRSVLDNILNQIRYYTEANFFDDPKMPDLLRTELQQMLDNRSLLAAKRNKGILENDSFAASFDLFLNEIVDTNNIVLVYSGEQPLAVYATMDSPNFLRSTDPVFCQRMHLWIQQIEDYAYHTGNEQQRVSLFKDLKAKVDIEKIAV